MFPEEEYLGAIFRVGVPIRAAPTAAAHSRQAQIMVGFPRSTCSVMTQASTVSCSGVPEKSILLP